jgi:hypothetical protein
VKSWSVIFATIVIFGAGVITGGLLVDHVQHTVHSRGAHPTTPPPPPDDVPSAMTPEFMKKQFVGQLGDQLQLSKEQREQIQKIIAQGQQNTRDLWKLVRPQFQIVWHDTRQQIRSVLTPEQQKQFEMLMKQQRHPQSTNAPAVPMPASTNAPVAPTNGPVI